MKLSTVRTNALDIYDRWDTEDTSNWLEKLAKHLRTLSSKSTPEEIEKAVTEAGWSYKPVCNSCEEDTDKAICYEVDFESEGITINYYLCEKCLLKSVNMLA